NGRAYQGAKGPVYPYVFLDGLTDVKQDKAYKAVYLENRYLKLCVLPEIGGRLFAAQDKTNGYDFIYRQHVIKPALIGMLGAWISGGVEWNVPHHHRATAFLPVDHLIVNGADGSATVWVGEIELRQRTKWIVGLTMRPDSSAVEVTIRVFNRTPLAQSMLCFANAAISADPDYQVIFPPDTTLAAFHGKNQFSHWPVSTEVYNGQDYRAGVDVSWWKSHVRPTSFFAFNGEGNFLAGYDHGRDAGICFVADHHFVPGKKLWTWGTGPDGALWEKILTDADGPYAELMFGSFSDNQPDYSWTQPYETRSVKQWWYPLRGTGGVKAATKDAACELTIAGGRKARMGFYATRDFPEARAILSVGIRTVYEETVSIGPDRPFVRETAIPEGVDPDALSLSLVTAEGRELVRYAPVKIIKPGLPPAVVPPLAPKDIPTVEELYLTGLRLEQFYNPILEPYPYYEEVLRRDPGDYRTNVALAVLDLRRGLYREAEEKLERAVERSSRNYTRPKDGEALYYLGLARRALGKAHEAEDALSRASWDDGRRAAAFYALAEISARAGDYAQSLDRLDRARAADTQNPRTRVLEAALRRKVGELEKARSAAAEALALDPLDFWGWNEAALVRGGAGSDEGKAVLKKLTALMRDAPAAYLELAADYARVGLWDEGVEALERLIALNRKGSSDFPLVHYWLAWLFHQKGDDARAEERLRAAAAAPADYGFPFQLEMADILRWAQTVDASDAWTPYYLGNLLYDLQPEAALACWERAAALDPRFPTARRNLGLAYARIRNDLARSVKEYEAAVADAPEDAELYEELDRMYEAAGAPASKRLVLLEKNHKVLVKRDDALTREIKLLVQTGRYDRAIELIDGHHFHVWEGGGEIHGIFAEARLLRGEKLLEAGKWSEALRDFDTAATYPANLETAVPAGGGGSARISYLTGLAREGTGDAGLAREAFEKAVTFRHPPSEAAYFEALALRKLGRGGEAEEKLRALRSAAGERLGTSPSADFFEKFGEKQSAAARIAQAHYLWGLASLGLNETADAAAHFKAALAADPNFAAASRALAGMK
ncbi:MAG: DUF5107 domain-containing protein, partial [Candidatus Aminicenantales bacterium]